MQKEKQVVLTFLQICRRGYLQSTHESATTFQTFLMETHECCNLENNVTYDKSHNGVCHIRSVFHSHIKCSEIGGKFGIWDYFQSGCIRIRIRIVYW